MYEAAWEQEPANQVEKAFLCRMYRLFSILEALEDALQSDRPRIARDLTGIRQILECLAAAVESQIHRPGRLRVWLNDASQAKPPPASWRLLTRFLRLTRQAASAVLKAHDDVAPLSGHDECCCGVCQEVWELRWFLGETRRRLAPIGEAVHQ